MKNNIIEKIAVALFASSMVALLGYAFFNFFLSDNFYITE